MTLHPWRSSQVQKGRDPLAGWPTRPLMRSFMWVTEIFAHQLSRFSTCNPLFAPNAEVWDAVFTEEPETRNSCVSPSKLQEEPLPSQEMMPRPTVRGPWGGAQRSVNLWICLCMHSPEAHAHTEKPLCLITAAVAHWRSRAACRNKAQL